MNIRQAVAKISEHKNATGAKNPLHIDPGFVGRAEKAHRRNLRDPGDCEGDEFLLLGLSIAEADIGQGTGWIPEVQRVGVEYAKILETA
jgi:hypothetical protein